MKYIFTILKASINSTIALLDKETLEESVKQVQEFNAGAIARYGICNVQDLKTNKGLAFGRIALDIIPVMYDLATVYDVNQLHSDKPARKILEFGTQLVIDISGWTKEEIDNIVNDDFSSPILSTRLCVALSQPKGESVVSECKDKLYEVLNPLIQPIMETVSDMQHDSVAQVYQIIDSVKKFNSPFFTNDEGMVLSIKQSEAYAYTKSAMYHLTVELGINKELAHHFLSNNDKTYHIPDEAWKIIKHSLGPESDMTLDEMNHELSFWLHNNPGPHKP